MKPSGHAEMTPIENLLTGDALRTYSTDYRKLWQRRCNLNLRPVYFYKLLFGQQDYCCQGKYRYWVWVHEDCRILVNNIRGMLFEVSVETKTSGEALRIWKQFYRKTLKRIHEVRV